DGAAAQRLRGLRAAAEVVDGDVEALLLEVAEPLADRERQIVERGLAADGERELLLLDRLAMRGRAERKREREGDNGGLGCFHLLLPAADGGPVGSFFKTRARRGKGVRRPLYA